MFYSNRFTWICIFAIVFTYAAALDEECANEKPCPALGNICRNGRCQCNTPFYKPCNSSCDIVRQVISEGDRCVVTENCVDNAYCRDEKCQCVDGFMARNGACFRNLYTICTTDKECWSKYCPSATCQCPPGSEPTDNVTTCRQKLVDVYENWDEASRANAFCQNKASCYDTAAECFNDTNHPQSKFCKCPTGYQIISDSNRRRCEAIKSQYLSPIETDVIECGTCTDDRAVCTNAAGKQTCWCQAGYEKNGDKCQPLPKLAFVFPNDYDRTKHDFTSGCSSNTNGMSEINDGLCVCARGFEFDVANRSCKKIERQEYKPIFEYGLCTQINSYDAATPQIGLCPEPLQCLPRTNKYVCSCGTDQFLDLDNSTQCVYYIGKGAGQTNRKCPGNTKNNASGNCECKDGYAIVNNNRQCELKLSNKILADGPCAINGSSYTVCERFGNKVVLCNTGECRCAGNVSFPNEDQTECQAPLEQQLEANRETCPPNSIFQTDQCKCNAGYRPSLNLRQCDRWTASLVDYKGSSTSSGDLNTNDCQVLFTGPVEVYDNNQCQCISNAFSKEDRSGCLYKLNVDLGANANITFCPPGSTFGVGYDCTCRTGYTTAGNKCVPLIDQVYLDEDTNKPSIAGLDNKTCKVLFGYGSLKSTLGDYCICGSYAFRTEDFKRCLFYLNETNTEFKNVDNCPENANATELPTNQNQSTCVCNSNYYASADRKSCEPANISLVGIEEPNNNDKCLLFTNLDCAVKFGPNAFCKDDKCYCNRKTSIKTNNDQCEPINSYKFPAEHDLYRHVCNEDKDCGGKSNVVCDYSTVFPGYKVCQCQEGSFLNPITLTCEIPCTNCNLLSNFDCFGYGCRCKSGYSQQGNDCVAIAYPKLQLYERCNASISGSNYADPLLVCDRSCSRTFCTYGYRSENDQCVRYQLRSDRCIQNPTICQSIDWNADCSREVNQCLCKGFFYPYENQCARSVSYICTDDNQCGAGECKAGRCACRGNQRIEEMQDIDNRNIQYCVQLNGVNRLCMNWLLFSLLSLICTRLF